MIKIGDRFLTDGFGEVEVVDVLMSPTSQKCCYEVKNRDNGQLFLVYGEDLTYNGTTIHK